MKAMLLEKTCDLMAVTEPLRLADVERPEPLSGEVRIRVNVCAVCHTELDEIEGRTPPPVFPVIPGHQVVGTIDALGAGVTTHAVGDRVGVGWIFSACGECEQCQRGNENLCAEFQATGRDRHGGYGEYMCAPAGFAIPVPDALPDIAAAPLFCAGAIGYRSLRLTGLTNGEPLGLTGFGASAHLVLKLAQRQFPDSAVFVFARSAHEQAFARELGASWAGGTDDRPPAQPGAIIDTTPAWQPILAALKCLAPGGRLVINAIRKESKDQHLLSNLSYPEHLWMEKEIKSVANVTRRDIAEFLALAAELDLKPQTQTYALAEANQAILEVKRGDIQGAKVLQVAD
ncbi:MAG: zinc-dependent alcohol dehydrogenase family protein [Pseudomonadota bacterium]